jgi:hypothetical protein
MSVGCNEPVMGTLLGGVRKRCGMPANLFVRQHGLAPISKTKSTHFSTQKEVVGNPTPPPKKTENSHQEQPAGVWKATGEGSRVLPGLATR